MVAVEKARPRLAEGDLRIPHQRPVGEDPDRFGPCAQRRDRRRHRIDRVDRDVGVGEIGNSHLSKALKLVIPAKAGIHYSAFVMADKWIPAFPTEQVRGLKAHGTTIGWSVVPDLLRHRQIGEILVAERPLEGDPGHVEQHHPLPGVLRDMPGRAFEHLVQLLRPVIGRNGLLA